MECSSLWNSKIIESLFGRAFKCFVCPMIWGPIPQISHHHCKRPGLESAVERVFWFETGAKNQSAECSYSAKAGDEEGVENGRPSLEQGFARDRGNGRRVDEIIQRKKNDIVVPLGWCAEQVRIAVAGCPDRHDNGKVGFGAHLEALCRGQCGIVEAGGMVEDVW